MAKRMQEQKEEKKIVEKSKPMAMNLSSTVSASSSPTTDLIASKGPEGTRGFTETWRQGKKKSQNPMHRRVLKWGCKMQTLAGWWIK